MIKRMEHDTALTILAPQLLTIDGYYPKWQDCSSGLGINKSVPSDFSKFVLKHRIQWNSVCAISILICYYATAYLFKTINQRKEVHIKNSNKIVNIAKYTKLS